MRSCTLITTMFLLVANSYANTENSKVDRYELFNLFTDCTGVDLVVEKMNIKQSDSYVSELRLEESDIVNAVESRLRSSDVFLDSKSGPYLIVRVSFLSIGLTSNPSGIGFCYTIRFDLAKSVYDASSRSRDYARTWGKMIVGTCDFDSCSDEVLSTVRRMTERFINEWYKVNKPDGKCLEIQ